MMSMTPLLPLLGLGAAAYMSFFMLGPKPKPEHPRRTKTRHEARLAFVPLPHSADLFEVTRNRLGEAGEIVDEITMRQMLRGCVRVTWKRRGEAVEIFGVE